MFGFKKYKVDYCGEKSFFKGARDSFRAGKKVVLYYDLIATDTDYSFYINGTKIQPLYYEKKGYKIVFKMPSHDVKIMCEGRNSMLPFEQ